MALQWQNYSLVRNYSLEMFLEGKRGYRTENSVFFSKLFFFLLLLYLLLPSFAVEIVLSPPEGMAENCKAFMFCLQMDKFPLKRLLRDFLVRQVWVPFPTMFPDTVPW